MRRDGSEIPVELTITRNDVDDEPLFIAFLRDLSGMHAAEAAREEAEQRYRELVEQVPTVTYVCELDEDASVRYISPQVERLTGYPPERWTEAPVFWKTLIHPDDREWLWEEIDRCARGEIPIDVEYRMIAADGSIVHVWDQETIVRDADGRALFSQGVMIDVTELRATKAALETTERQLRTIVDSRADGPVRPRRRRRVHPVRGAGARLRRPRARRGRRPLAVRGLRGRAADRQGRPARAGRPPRQRGRRPRRVRVRGGVLPGGRAGRAGGHRRRHRRHGAHAQRAAARPSRLPRPAHRTRQPGPARGAPRHGGGRRRAQGDDGRAAQPRPRRLQDPQRVTRPRGGRRTAVRARAPGSTPAWAATTCSRAPAATSSC